MANSFRSAFIVTAILTLVTFPAVMIGFFPITLIMGMISIVCLILWVTMRNIYGETEVKQAPTQQAYTPPVDTSQITVGGESKSNEPK
jgi:hypothetical protein